MKCTPLVPGTRCGGWVIAAATITVVLTLFHVKSADAACTLSGPTTWTLGSSGSWSVNGNWTPATFPNSSGTNVCIVDGVSTVTLSASVSTASLQLAAGNALDIAIGNSLSVSGPAIVNAGTITLNGGGATNTIVQIGNSLSLSGGGVVNMSIAGGGGSAFLRGSGVTLTNTDNTIQGAGFIGDSGALGFVNQATVDANASGLALNLNAGNGDVTNTGLLEASSGGTLQLFNTINNAGGNITVADSTSTVLLNGATVQGGTLNNSAGGVFETNPGGAATLDNVTISAGSTYTASTGSTTTLLDGLTNRGTLQVNGGGATNAIVQIGNSLSLSGGGVMNMSIAGGGGSAFLRGSGVTLTNTNNIIEGAGFIGDSGALAFVNGSAGTLLANASGQSLTVGGGGGAVT